MRIDSRVSNRYYAIYFIAACVVVSIHCAIEMPTDGALQNLYVRHGTKWAVPFSFLMSGAFLGNGYVNTYEGFHAACVGKFRSLVIPYLLWCTIGFAMRSPLIFDQLSSLGLLGSILAVWGVDRAFPLGNGVLWFLRSLILIQYGFFVVLGCFSKEKKLQKLCCSICIGVFLLMCFLHPAFQLCVDQLGNPSAPFYFLLGYISSKFLLRPPNKFMGGVFIGAGLVGFVASWAVGVGDGSFWRHCSNVLLFMILIAAADYFVAIGGRVPRCTFFIYCFHRVPVEYGGWVMKHWWTSAPDVGYVLFVGMAILFSLCMAMTMRKFVPRAYAMLNGGRG